MTMLDSFPKLVFGYTNHRNEYSVRVVIVPVLYYGNSAYYPDDQWMLRGYDLVKNAWRDFAIKKIDWSGE